jgi:hypothetical protein
MASETTPLLDNPRIALSRSDAQFVEGLLETWQECKVIDAATSAQLLATIDARERFDWSRLAKFAFRLALISFAIAIFSLLFDSAFLNLIKHILEVPAYIRTFLTAAVAYIIHYLAYKRSREFPMERWTNEAIHAVAAIIQGLAALQLAEAIGALKGVPGEFNIKVRLVLLLLGFLYTSTGVMTGSTLIWSFGVFTFGWWTLVFTPTRYV